MLVFIAIGVMMIFGILQGGAPEGAATDWVPEPSLLLLIDDPTLADALMLTFEQNAVVLCDAHGFCTLRWHPYLPD